MIDTRKSTQISRTTAGVGNVFSALVNVLKAASERRATRAALGRLDDHILRDIGLNSPAQRDAVLKYYGLE